jgi:hypothetical protein
MARRRGFFHDTCRHHASDPLPVVGDGAPKSIRAAERGQGLKVAKFKRGELSAMRQKLDGAHVNPSRPVAHASQPASPGQIVWHRSSSAFFHKISAVYQAKYENAH